MKKLKVILAAHPILTLCWMGVTGLATAWMGYKMFGPVFQAIDFIDGARDFSWVTLPNLVVLLLAAVFGMLGLFFYIQFKVCEKVIVEELLK